MRPSCTGYSASKATPQCSGHMLRTPRFEALHTEKERAMKTLITVAALALGLAVPALAQDTKPVVTPPVAPAAKPAETPKATPAVARTQPSRQPTRPTPRPAPPPSTTRMPRRSTRRRLRRRLRQWHPRPTPASPTPPRPARSPPRPRSSNGIAHTPPRLGGQAPAAPLPGPCRVRIAKRSALLLNDRHQPASAPHAQSIKGPHQSIRIGRKDHAR